jgi:2-polyprenyl-3-methyl-5-hydroxy-6-metoxy-1,4-benzoquinol methylase
MRKIPTSSELENYYSIYAYESEKEIPEATRISIEYHLDKFEKYRKNNKMLDVGCGEGWILESAKARGWEVYGTEFSSNAIEICRKKGIKMYTGVLKPEDIEERDFDVIISTQAIEHINNPREEVSNIHQLLRTGGLFYITTPNFNSYLRLLLRDKYSIIEYPEHLSYYTRKTLNKLLQQSGFRKVKLLTTGISVSHYQISNIPEGTAFAKNTTEDEKLRSRIANSRVLRLAKNIINSGLSVLGIGMTLKAFYIKK